MDGSSVFSLGKQCFKWREAVLLWREAVFSVEGSAESSVFSGGKQYFQ